LAVRAFGLGGFLLGRWRRKQRCLSGNVQHRLAFNCEGVELACREQGVRDLSDT
jgi:hypothetical protein